MKRNNFDEPDALDSPRNEMEMYWHNEYVAWIGQCIDRWIKSHEIACISAFRGVHTNMGESQSPHYLTLAENATRQNGLYATLLDLGYGILSENFEEGVNSTIVLNLQNDSRFYDNLFMLSEYYNQDGFIHKAADEEMAFLVGTNNSPFPGYAKKVEVGYLHRKVDNELIRQLESMLSQMSDIKDIIHSMKQPSPSEDMADAKANLERIMDTKIEEYFLKDSLVMHTMYDRMNLACTARNVIHDMQQTKKQ